MSSIFGLNYVREAKSFLKVLEEARSTGNITCMQHVEYTSSKPNITLEGSMHVNSTHNVLLKTGLEMIKTILYWCVQIVTGVLKVCHEELTSSTYIFLQAELFYHPTSKHSVLQVMRNKFPGYIMKIQMTLATEIFIVQNNPSWADIFIWRHSFIFALPGFLTTLVCGVMQLLYLEASNIAGQIFSLMSDIKGIKVET